MITELQCILSFVSECTICSGNADPKFAPIVAKCKGLFKDRSGQPIIMYNRNTHQVKLIGSIKCFMFKHSMLCNCYMSVVYTCICL